VEPGWRLRRREGYHAIRKAMQSALPRADFRIVHISLEQDHVHMLVEAASGAALRRGMHGLLVSAARRINAMDGGGGGRRARLVTYTDERGCRRQRVVAASRPGLRGAVFGDRYHLVAITSARQARNVIRYVLCNYRHHNEANRGWDVDYYSSGPSFRGWAEYATSSQPFRQFADYQPLPVKPACTSLLAKDWHSAGPISLYDVPCSMLVDGRLISMRDARRWG
jgi:hypothetical protein